MKYDIANRRIWLKNEIVNVNDAKINVLCVAALREGTADIAVVTTPTVRSASLSETTVKPVNEVAVCSKSFSSLIGRKVSLSELKIGRASCRERV